MPHNDGLHLIHFAAIEVEAIVDFAIDLCVAFVGFAMTEVEAILFIATYLCVALDISCNVQQRRHWFYYHDRHYCFATLDLVAIASIVTIRCCGNMFFSLPRLYLVAKVYIATQRFGGNCIFCHHKYL